ncbi:MAG TPA: bifunctional riboflavin kinase/FAD synthetase [Acidimicrobiales bacterium]|nr:bifunctional riboflavin kinase/FAD synthetase [Acidimicrobiales bacterium]
MEVVTDPASLSSPPAGTVVTIGAYDGVHIGHRRLIGEVRAHARARGLAAGVVTFDRHPAMVVRPESAPLLLTDLDQKLALLATTGLDLAVVLAFDRARSEETAEDFVTGTLVEGLAAKVVVVGRDFHFGHGRKGNVPLLAEMGADLGFEVVGFDLVPEAGGSEPVSSTRIRRLLTAGQVAEAAALLGRPHEVRGVVGRGDGRGGAVLGYPTANVAVPPEILLPADGIYAGWHERPDGSVLPAAISVGRRPTFYQDGPPLLEAYLLGFDGDLYGETARVRFVARLRDEQRFDSVADLAAQMGQDVDAARAALARP